MHKIIFKETFRDGGVDGSWGRQTFPIKDFIKIIDNCLTKCAETIEFSWQAHIMELKATRLMSEEEVIQEAIQDLTQKLKVKTEELLSVQNKIK